MKWLMPLMLLRSPVVIITTKTHIQCKLIGNEREIFRFQLSRLHFYLFLNIFFSLLLLAICVHWALTARRPRENRVIMCNGKMLAFFVDDYPIRVLYGLRTHTISHTMLPFLLFLQSKACHVMRHSSNEIQVWGHHWSDSIFHCL